VSKRLSVDRFLPSILAEGLRPGRRNAVHLSSDVATARVIGGRRGRPVVLRVDAARLRPPARSYALTIAATGPPPEGPWCTAATDTKTAGSPVTDAATPPTVALIWRCQKTSESSSMALRRPRT
jgi:hypothetical protein